MSDNVMREKAFFNVKVTNLARGQLTCGSIDLWENCGRGDNQATNKGLCLSTL